MDRRKKIVTTILVVLIFLLVIIVLWANFNIGPYISNIDISESKTYDNKVIFNVEIGNYFFKIDKSTWCILTDVDTSKPDVNDDGWQKAENGYCSFTVENGEYDVYVKDKYGNINDIDSQLIQINKVIEIKANKSALYMWKGREEKISYELVTVGNVLEKVSFTSLDDSVATVDDDGKVTGVGYGTTNIQLTSESGVTSTVQVIVSEFITTPKVDTSKDYISCKQFTSSEADLIDKILFDRIDDAGYGTRAGVVAAARFLTLEFAYRIHYFYENGRLNNYYPYEKVDGEGRYYHRGLYLNESKFAEITASLVGPAIWGCNLQNYTDWGPYITGKYYPNGLDCSGFVTWALLNGGFDIGDIGAGENEDHDDLDDLGEKVYITEELMSSGRVKVGDLIGLNGHMAILAGWDDNNYYIAESLNTTGGVVMTVVAKNKLVNNSIYTYIILMDDVYKEDGNLSTMW